MICTIMEAIDNVVSHRNYMYIINSNFIFITFILLFNKTIRINKIEDAFLKKTNICILVLNIFSIITSILVFSSTTSQRAKIFRVKPIFIISSSHSYSSLSYPNRILLQ